MMAQPYMSLKFCLVVISTAPILSFNMLILHLISSAASVTAMLYPFSHDYFSAAILIVRPT